MSRKDLFFKNWDMHIKSEIIYILLVMICCRWQYDRLNCGALCYISPISLYRAIKSITITAKVIIMFKINILLIALPPFLGGRRLLHMQYAHYREKN